MKKQTNLLIGLTLVTLSAVILLVLNYSKTHSLEAQIVTYEEELSDCKSAQDMWKMLLEADEQFCSGNFEKALDLYAQFDDISGMSLAGKRRQWLDEADSSAQFLRIVNVALQRDMVDLKRKNEQVTTELTELRNERDDMANELRRSGMLYQNRLDSLKQSFQREKSQLATNAKYDTLTFSSNKNYKIRYHGQVTGAKANGIGSGNWSTGGYYHGEWKNNQRHGKGVYYWNDGDKYVGEYVNDIRQGIGTYYWKNGEKYEGAWKNNQRNGFGTLYDAFGKVKFKGEWVNDQPKE